MLGRDEDKVALVLGHELAHVLARHHALRYTLRLIHGAVASMAVALIRNAVQPSACAPPCQRHSRRAPRVA